MQRRSLLTLTVALPLAACGFRLRGAPQFGFRSLFIHVQAAHGLARELTRSLQDAPNLQLLTEPAQLPQAEAVLELLSENRERVVVGLSAAGQVRELQLRLGLRFRLRGQQGQELIPETHLQQQRDISYNEALALSKEDEEQMLMRNMQTDLVQQLMRRLAAVKPQ